MVNGSHDYKLGELNQAIIDIAQRLVVIEKSLDSFRNEMVKQSMWHWKVVVVMFCTGFVGGGLGAEGLQFIKILLT
jgi:hypothetical protein